MEFPLALCLPWSPGLSATTRELIRGTSASLTRDSLSVAPTLFSGPELLKVGRRQRACEIHIERGGIHGCDLEDLLQAQREFQQQYKHKEKGPDKRRTNREYALHQRVARTIENKLRALHAKPEPTPTFGS